jgi:hypothetical protein
MDKRIEIENIEEMRRQQGIDDVELAEEIRRLKVGHVVVLTLLSSARCFETVPVRITQTNGVAFRGKLVRSSSFFGRGKMLEFTIAHIHSVISSPAKYASSSSLH